MITSKSNAWFKRVRDAIREHSDEIVVEGPKAVADAIAAEWKPLAVFSVAASPPAGTHALSAQLFKAISDTKTSQGVIGLFERPRWSAEQILSKRDALAVALDAVQDPGNVGTIVRLAAAFDAAGVILLPGTADPFSPKAIRASAGAILSVPIVSMTAAELLATGRPLFAADSRGPTDVVPRGILILGNEGQGVSAAFQKGAQPIGIETSRRVESLNVAAAAAILLWQNYLHRRGA
jgi:TrmH family RNA methyltransferase